MGNKFLRGIHVANSAKTLPMEAGNQTLPQGILPLYLQRQLRSRRKIITPERQLDHQMFGHRYRHGSQASSLAPFYNRLSRIEWND